MTCDCQRIDQIHNRIGALPHTLVYFFSELLGSHFLDRLCFYQQFHFLLRCYFYLSNSKVKFNSERINVEFKVVKAGLEQIILSNEIQNSPCQIILIVLPKDKAFRFTITIPYGGVDALTAGRALHIHRIIAKGGEIRVRFLTVEDEILLPVTAGLLEERPLSFIQLIENVERFQQKTGKKIQFPKDGSFTSYGL